MKHRHTILLFKILFIMAAFAFIFLKANIEKIWFYITSIGFLPFIGCVFLMVIAQITSAYRMIFYYKNEGLTLKPEFSIGLYFTAMLFNNILPGGIGGDAYKIYLIGKLKNFSHLRAFQITISERANGLFILCIITGILYFFSNFRNIYQYSDLFIAILIIISVPIYLISSHILLKEQYKTCFIACIFSIPVQLINLTIALIILYSLDLTFENANVFIGYLTMFMASSIVAVIPVSIGGIGLRELTFLYGTSLVGLDPELGIGAAILFFCVSAFTSLIGLYFWPRLENTSA